MDMDLDIPAPDELEWLESSAFYHGEDSEEHEHVVVEEEDRNGEDPPPVPQNQIPRKRAWSEENGISEASASILDGPNRETKRRPSAYEEEEEEEEEEWLRHPPTKDAAADDVVPQGQDQNASTPLDKFISRFASEIEGDCMPVTGPCGERVYAKLCAGVMGREQMPLYREKTSNVIIEPIGVLIQRLEQEALQKALQESFGLAQHENQSTTHALKEQLWVEKYAPSSFKELLSDEQTNREVLLWLKQWDSCVFGSQVRATADDVLSALRRHSSIAQHHVLSENKIFNRNKKFSFGSQHHKHSNFPDREKANLRATSDTGNGKFIINHGPEQKVLLLCGPPGLGKTTLAHIAAKHCGYHVVEINASDDRSSSMIESKVLDVVQMNSVTADSKPKCLVIDEIDGALGDGKGAVEVILRMVEAEKKSNVEKRNAGQDAQPEKSSLRKGRKTTTLSRPVICICNDLYSPALRPLRQVAKVRMFVHPTASRIVNRLKYICNREGFRTSSIALSALAEYTGCDIRSCLNTLQFLSKKKQDLSIVDIGSQVVGQKDISRSCFDVWKEVFQKRKPKREKQLVDDTGRHRELDFLYSLISNCGDHELTMDGIHENFLQLSYHDPKMEKTARCLDNMGFSDLLHHYILRTQQMPLQVYQPPIMITMRYLIAQVGKPNIEWPKSLQRCRIMLTEKKDLLKSWQNKIAPAISRHLSIESFVEDTISPFLHVLSPPALRPVALHLLSDREKDDLAQLADIMVSYSLTYKSSKPEPLQRLNSFGLTSDAPVLSLDPPINDLVSFKDHQSERNELSVAMMQVISHEAEKLKILRGSIGKSADPTNESSIGNPTSGILNAEVIPPISISTTVSNEGSSRDKGTFFLKQKTAHASQAPRTKLSSNLTATGELLKAPGDSKRRSSQSSSFFDRFRKGSNPDSAQTGDGRNAATNERGSRPFLFKYNEGFTNAVKRPVKVRELLP